jgi:hypothetical protein
MASAAAERFFASSVTCVVCLDEEVDSMPDPCRHAAYCAPCLAELMRHGARCAICRREMRGSLAVAGRAPGAGAAREERRRRACCSEQLEQDWERFVVSDADTWERWRRLGDAEREDVNNMLDRSLDELMGRHGRVLSRATCAAHPDPQAPWMDNPHTRAALERTGLPAQRPRDGDSVMA